MSEGWIAIAGESGYSHTFGGQPWTVVDESRVADGPHLLLNLDTSDPNLGEVRAPDIRHVPICSYVNCDVWVHPQEYSFAPDTHQVVFTNHSTADFYELPADLRYENPLPKVPLTLRSMTEAERGQTDEDYWSASDDFLGGESFIRVLGPPLWLQHPDTAECRCGRTAAYLCSIGYEFLEDYGITGKRPFFIGEAALYFFVCTFCKIIVVKSQSS